VLRRVLAILILVGLLASACSSGSDDTASSDVERTGPQGSILPPADVEPDFSPDEQEAAPEENPDDGRLVVQDQNSQLSTMLPDGSEVAELTDPGTINSQPSWAPDGSRVAWVSIDEPTGQVRIAADRFDRSDYRDIDIDEAPFYLYWDPSASRIAHLSPSTGGIDLGIAELLAEDGPTNRRIDRGQPYFLAWGPDGDELLVHASGFRLDRIDLGSATVIVDEFPASFGAATWLPDDSLLYADIEEDQQYLVTTGDAGEGRRPLITYSGSLRFSVSNEGNRIVMQAVSGVDEDPLVTASADPIPVEDDGMLISAQPQPTPTPTPEFDDSLDAIDPIEVGIPYLMGTFGGEPVALSDNPAIALFPSPDGQAIAWLEAALGEQGAMTLQFDSNGRRTLLPPFVPSAETSTAYLPFFDQYSQSHDFWSPSSNLFVWAGHPAGSGEPDGIWIFDRTTGQQTRIADGVVASFTRTPEAGGARSAL
jgi:TolB protein